MRVKIVKIKPKVEKFPSRDELIQQFYEVLATRTFSPVKCDIYINGLAILSTLLKQLIFDTMTTESDDSETKLLSPDLAKALAPRLLQRRVDLWNLQKGTQKLSVLSGPLGAFTLLGGSEVRTSLQSSHVFHKFDSATGPSEILYDSGNYAKVIFYDVVACQGHFVLNPNPLGVTKDPDPRLMNYYLILGHKRQLKLPQVRKWFRETLHLDLWDSDDCFSYSAFPSIGCFLPQKDCQLLWRAMLQQSFDKFRTNLLRPVAGLFYNNPIWHMTLETTASLRDNTIKGYISSVSQFSKFSSIPVKTIFEQISDQTIDYKLLYKWFRLRIDGYEVQIDTALSDIVAFGWFCKKLCHKTFKELWPKIVNWANSLQKRLGGRKNPSDTLSWKEIRKVWISETVGLTHGTTSLVGKSQSMLHIYVYDAKSSYQNMIQ